MSIHVPSKFRVMLFAMFVIPFFMYQCCKNFEKLNLRRLNPIAQRGIIILHRLLQ